MVKLCLTVYITMRHKHGGGSITLWGISFFFFFYCSSAGIDWELDEAQDSQMPGDGMIVNDTWTCTPGHSKNIESNYKWIKKLYSLIDVL